ncbi:plasmid mobilization relaxosome protein MobC [Tritonibacter mobilis]|uniref:plasmid mobilization relaxosome protein MobC n=1 Tax=Tritonibacter mobilis TaxID=379347 RepID=UPI001D0DA655|nr:plasmid mobilization relaxosome protein MobC [Tritonibacter mobilis]
MIFSEDAPRYRKRRKTPVEEQRLLAEILARLGQSRQANNLNQIAKHLNLGALVVDPDLEEDLKRAIAEVSTSIVRVQNVTGTSKQDLVTTVFAKYGPASDKSNAYLWKKHAVDQYVWGAFEGNGAIKGHWFTEISGRKWSSPLKVVHQLG